MIMAQTNRCLTKKAWVGSIKSTTATVMVAQATRRPKKDA